MTYIRDDDYTIPEHADVDTLRKILKDISSLVSENYFRLVDPSIRIKLDNENSRRSLKMERIHLTNSFPPVPDYIALIISAFDLKLYATQTTSARDLVAKVLEEHPPLKKAAK